jgi:acyl-coenzyme A thioesterase PaaI-like protein
MQPELESALLARINRIPIVATLGLEIVRFSDGYCESRTPRSLKYDGVLESFHGGLLMTTGN